MRAILLAGGKGTRLRPYTTFIPKPLMPIGNEYSILEIIIRQLASKGFDHVTICLNHLAQLIIAFIGDGSQYGITIDYSMENKSLSTIGPLTLIDDLPEDFLVMNGDILCDLDYREFFNFHMSSKNDVTVSTHQRDTKIDFGVIESSSDGVITAFKEKPVYSFEISMGIYCINNRVVNRLERDVPYGFDNLMLDGVKNHAGYKTFPFSGFWLDIGRPEDYDFCNEHYPEIKGKLGL